MNDAKERYADIIDRPHHVSRTHAQMPTENRAAQFAPFAALTGYDDLIRESERETEQRILPDENARDELDAKLLHLLRTDPPDHYIIQKADKRGYQVLDYDGDDDGEHCFIEAAVADKIASPFTVCKFSLYGP